jgi:hypothetical protein
VVASEEGEMVLVASGVDPSRIRAHGNYYSTKTKREERR